MAKARDAYFKDGGGRSLAFEEGVDGLVPYAGRLEVNVQATLNKLKSTMCNCGALTIAELRQNARLVLVSPASIRKGGAHDVLLSSEQQ